MRTNEYRTAKSDHLEPASVWRASVHSRDANPRQRRSRHARRRCFGRRDTRRFSLPWTWRYSSVSRIRRRPDRSRGGHGPVVNFLVDAQLPPGLARWLADQGHSAQHVNDVGLAGAEDFVIWNHALGVDAIIVTKTRTLPSGPHERVLGQWSSGFESETLRTVPFSNGWNRAGLLSFNSWLTTIDWSRSGDRLFRLETTFPQQVSWMAVYMCGEIIRSWNVKGRSTRVH